MRKKGSAIIIGAGVVLVLAILILGPMAVKTWTGKEIQPLKVADHGALVELASNCPDSGLTDWYPDVRNFANDTSTEAFDLTYYLFRIDDGVETFVTSTADTTSPSATDIQCGAWYVSKAVSTSGASGDSSVSMKKLSGDGDMEITSDGNVMFFAQGAEERYATAISQHATLSVRAYDNILRGAMCYGGDTACATAQTDGVTFQSKTNGTVIDETSGLDIEFELIGVQADTEYNDRGILVLVEAPVGTWDEPAVYFNGAKLSEATGLLNEDEKTAYTDYEYVYLIPSSASIKDGSGKGLMDFRMSLASGVSTSSADPEIDFAIRGQYLSNDGFVVKEGAVTDATSPAQVHTLFDITLDVTA